jgi:hypothetical protein
MAADSRDYERLAETDEALIYASMACLMTRRLARTASSPFSDSPSTDLDAPYSLGLPPGTMHSQAISCILRYRGYVACAPSGNAREALG